MSKICIGCGTKIHPKRVEILPHTKTCVNCSTTEKKGGLTIQLGEGDHTYNEIIVMDREDLIKIEELQNKHKKVIDGSHKAEMLNYDENEEDNQNTNNIDDSNILE
jgi:hypothetical protein